MRPEKQLLIDELDRDIEHYSSFMLMRHTGLKANVANQLRQEVAGVGGSVTILKKRVLNKAMEKQGIQFENLVVDGHFGIIFSGKDPIPCTKTVFEFSKNNGDIIEVVAGYFEGRALTAEEMKTLSNLPSREVMRAQFLGTLAAPLTQTLGVMSALIASVVNCLDQKSKL